MKKYILIVLIVTIVVLIGILGVKAANLYYVPISYSPNVASTTASLIVGGTSTTTKTIASDGYQQLTYLVALASSSTPPTLCWMNEYSSNGVDWYGEDYSYASTTVHISTQKQECWLYSTTTAGNTVLSRGTNGVTSFIGRKIVIPNLDTMFTRTIFSINSGVNALLDIRRILKNEIVLTK